MPTLPDDRRKLHFDAMWRDNVRDGQSVGPEWD
jgi:hypothetical protein